MESTQLTTNATTGLDLFNPQSLASAMELAKAMSTASGFVPKHLLGNPGSCLGVVSLAAVWRVNPFLLAKSTADIHGKLMFEATAVQAGIERGGAISGRLSFTYIGDWSKVRGRFQMCKSSTKTDENGQPKQYAVGGWKPEDEEGLAIDVTGTPAGQTEPVTVRTWLKACQPRNSTLWGTDPETQCRYRATRNWARLAVPAMMLGATTADEYEPSEVNVTALGSDAPAPAKPESRIRKPKIEAPAAEPDAAVATAPAAIIEPDLSTPAAVPYKLASAIAAVDAKGVPRDFLLSWLRHRGTLTAEQGIDDLPQAAIDFMVTDPAAVAKAVSDYADQQ